MSVSSQRSALRRDVAGATIGLSIAIVLVLLLPVLSTAASVPPPTSTPGPCPGRIDPGSASGTLTVVGAPLAGSTGVIADVPLSYSYYVQANTVDTRTGALLDEQCTFVHGLTNTNATGSFAFTPYVPSEHCILVAPGDVCTRYIGPFSPMHVLPASSAPPGYELSTSENGTTFHLAWVVDLATVALAPSGPAVTVSTDAPLTVAADPQAGDGSASPVTPAYAWTIAGTGWTFVTPPDGRSAEAVAAPGAAIGTLSVVARATVDGVPLVTPVTSVMLVAVATTLAGADVTPTTIDAGASVAASVTAVGADGYPYTATIAPGLGEATIGIPCTTAPSPGGTVTVTCATRLTYPSAGTADPFARVSNGYSSVDAALAPVLVDPPPALSADPTAPIGYAGEAIPIDLVVVPGSGTSPYEGACLATGSGTVDCSTLPGPTWSFDPVYPGAGRYSAVAWAVDATGVNRSVNVSVTVVAAPTLDPIAIRSATVCADTPAVAASTLVGGVLPARAWWNVSGVASPIATATLSADGPLSATFVPPAPGTFLLVLTVVDDLGTHVSVEQLLTVEPSPAVSLATVQIPSATPVTVGTPSAIAWEAIDARGAPVGSFSTPATLAVTDARTGAPLPAWVNSSGAGPLVAGPNGTFGIPASAWIDGILNLTVTPGTARSIAIHLAGTGLPASVPTVSLTAAPDPDRLRLLHPTVADAGARTNATFWLVTDRFGDPVPGTYLVVQCSLGGAPTDTLVPVTQIPGGASGAWINYSIPAPLAGSVEVLDPAGDLLLGPTVVAAAPATGLLGASGLLLLAVASAGAAGAGGAAVALVVRRRGRMRRSAPDPEPPLEEELKRLAEGRATVVAIVGEAGSADLATIATSWSAGPAPPDLAEWVASLVADGTLGTTLGPDRVARFCLAAGRPPDPRVSIDPEAFDRALRRWDAETAEDDAPIADDPESGPGDQAGSRPTRS